MIMRSARKKISGQLILLVAGLIIILAVILTLIFGDLVGELFVEPFLFLILLVQLYLASLPQLLIWLIFVAVLAVAAFFSVRKLAAKPHRQKIAEECKGETETKMGPVEELAWQIEWASRGEYFERKIRQRLIELAVELISREEGKTLEQAKELMKTGQWCQQKEIREFFAKDLKGRPLPLWEYLKGYLKPTRPGQFQRELAEVLQFLERASAHFN